MVSNSVLEQAPSSCPGEKIGTFCGLNSSWESTPDQRWAWVLIEVDLCEGMLEELDLVMGEHKWVQNIDYWKLLFRCYSLP
jgi:hypothetical protein